jgi:DNA polymerase-3 subunit gamma/tau
VLATTDPQKVSDTIRSRTQHLRFHLLPPDVLTEHVRWVVADAGLDVSADAVAAAVTQGAGSARDTLSALELIANAGGDLGAELTFDEFVEALIEHDAGRALTAMATLVNAGHDPRTIAEGLVKHLRNGFLCLMAPELVQLPAEAADELTERAQRLGAPALVAAIERLGEVLVELRHSPDPRVLVEVTLVQLCRERESDHDVAALVARVAKLEQALAAAPTAPPAPVDPATGRAKLGGHARQPASKPVAEVPPAPAAEPAAAPAAPAPEPAAAAAVGNDDLRTVWAESVRPKLRGLTRAVFAPVEVVAADGDVLTLAAPNPTHQTKCEQHVADVERALRDATGRAITVRWVSADGVAVTPAPSVAAAPPPDDDEHHVPDDSKPVLNGGQSVLDRLAEAFPGATLVAEEDR